MANVSEVITLGIGTPSSIAYLVLVGLGQSAAPDTRTIIGGTSVRHYDDSGVTYYEPLNIRRYTQGDVRRYDQ